MVKDAERRGGLGQQVLGGPAGDASQRAQLLEGVCVCRYSPVGLAEGQLSEQVEGLQTGTYLGGPCVGADLCACRSEGVDGSQSRVVGGPEDAGHEAADTFKGLAERVHSPRQA